MYILKKIYTIDTLIHIYPWSFRHTACTLSFSRSSKFGTTHSSTKYSWNRQSFVNSGWKVVSRCLPCLNATIVLGSVGSVSSSSRGRSAMEEGRREAEIREMTWIGGEERVGSRSRITGARMNTPWKGRLDSRRPSTSRSASKDST